MNHQSKKMKTEINYPKLIGRINVYDATSFALSLLSFVVLELGAIIILIAAYRGSALTNELIELLVYLIVIPIFMVGLTVTRVIKNDKIITKYRHDDLSEFMSKEGVLFHCLHMSQINIAVDIIFIIILMKRMIDVIR